MKKKFVLFVVLLLFAFGNVAMASTVSVNDWEGSVDSDYSNENNWLIDQSTTTNPPSGFESTRTYADYTRWITNYRVPDDTGVGSIINTCTIDGTFLMQKTRVMGNTTVTVSSTGVYDAYSIQVGSYGGPGHLVIDDGGLMTIAADENLYVGNFFNNGDGDGLLEIDGTANIDATGGYAFTLGGSGSTGQIDIGSTGILSYLNGGLNINAGSGVAMDLGAQYIRTGDWTGNDLLNMTGYSFGAGVTAIDYDYDGTKTTMTAIPEPLTLSLLGMGGLALLRRRR